jgi:endo-1,4-beta-xylanase
MRTSTSALLRACLLAFVSTATYAQTEPVIIEAEAGTLGSNLTTGVLDGTTYVTTTLNDTAAPATGRIATYTVNFPAAGNYELYARYRVGAEGANDDSWFLGQGFGEKAPGNGADWALQNETNTGFTAAGATVLNGGTSPLLVFKWVKVTGSQGPAAWVVPAGALTQTFQWASREDGMFMDKLAFGRAGVCYTVANLDAGANATGTCPPPPPPDPPPYTRTGAPIAAGQEKFLGSAWSPNTASLNFANYWNQVTPENGGKWGSVESVRDVMNWTQADAAYALAKANGFKFKWHTLIWGGQQPGWIAALPPAEQLEEIREWYAAIAARYPEIDQIDVVNEPIHQQPRLPASGGYLEALGGDNGLYGTGWDWVIKSFEMAREYFPNAQLLINDYSITNDGNATTTYLTIINLLKARGLIDGIGDQVHAFSTTEAAPMPNHRANLDRLAATGLPIYATEFDLDGVLQGVINNDVQLANYQRVFPVFWEHPAVKGVTIWGYVRGNHWRNAQGDWLLYENGGERPALQWLLKYVPDEPAVVTPGQVLSVNEAPESAERQAAIAFLQSAGYSVNDTTITTAALMAANPAPFTYQDQTFIGGLNNYDNSDLQARAFYSQYGHVGGVPVGTVVATDADADTTLSQWQMTSNCSQFAINPDTGAVNVMVGAVLDFESYTSCTAIVSVWDGYKRSEPQTVLIRTNNLNDNAPAITAGQVFAIDGGAHNVIDAIEVSDPDDAGQVGFTHFTNFALVSGNTNSVFRLRPNNGVLEVARPLLIDWRKTSYVLSAKVSDGTFTSAPETVTVNIPKRVELCFGNILRLEVPKATAPLAILLGSQLGDCSRTL